MPSPADDDGSIVPCFNIQMAAIEKKEPLA